MNEKNKIIKSNKNQKTPMSITNKLGIVLILIVLLPALIYTAYEFNSLNENEKLIADIYNQQLDAILFSVNQYTWDYVNNWGEEFEKYRMKLNPDSVSKLLMKDNSILLIAEIDSSLYQRSVFHYYNQSQVSNFIDQANENIKKQENLFNKIKEYKKQGYKKIETFIFQDIDNSGEDKIIFVFMPDYAIEDDIIVYIMTRTQDIIDIISKKLDDIASDQFRVGIFKQSQESPVYSNEPFQLSDVKQTKNIWIFPNYFLGISLRGESIEEVIRSRFFYSLGLILFVDLLLLVGVWFIFQTMKKEMALTKLKTDFVSNVSHELRTPLALIRMYAETLELNRVATEEKRNSYYRIIHQESERLTRLINNILNFSRIESGKKQYSFERIDLNDTVNKILDMYKYHLQNQDFKLNLETENSELFINADKEAVSEALINLLDNAIKYSDESKQIAISTGSQKGEVFLEVKDSGIGISKENQKYVFDKFYRVSTGSTFSKKGSGLGLSLVKHIMDSHDGKISVNSSPGKGSTFKLIFYNNK